jgi:DNA-binding transcriptional ArsR family regulator
MPSFSAQLQEHALDLTWSLWAELGVSGWRRRHTSHSIDPEPLILFTAMLGSLDPRLRDEATDWCIAYGRYVSAARLKNFLAAESVEVQAAFGALAATVNEHSALRWPGATEPRPYRPTARSEIPDFHRPSLLSLRLRALFGVGARAEILRAFLASPSENLSAADLAVDVGYTKRNVAEALDALRMGGLLEVAPHRNQLRYALAQQKELEAVSGPLPNSFPRWRSIFRILQRLLDTAGRAEKLTRRVQNVEADRTLRELEKDLRLVSLRPPISPTAEEAWAAFKTWALEVSEQWASGGPKAGSRRRSRAALSVGEPPR